MEKFMIQTERLLIRPLKRSDVNAFHFYRSNPQVTKYQGFDVMNKKQVITFINENKTKSFGKPGEWVQYGIENIHTKKLIGDCAIKLDQIDSRIGEIGITISHQEQRNGYAKEVITAILKFLFETKNLHRVVETVDVENEASIKLLKSTGFRQEGHFIENIFFKGKWGSEFQFAMLKKEWEYRKAVLS